MSPASAIAERVAAQLGLLPHDRWIGALERAEPELVRKHGQSLHALLGRMDAEPEIFLELAGLLSVGETYFLRHAPHFELMLDQVGQRLATLAPDQKVVIWSAGCSSGEEPYSVAIAIHARLGASALARVRIVGTDVDPRAIARAERGQYSPWSFRGAPAWIEAYFRPGPNGSRILQPGPVRQAVTLRNAPLQGQADELEAGSVDVIFFRNVAIYLTDEARERLHASMHRALRSDGTLLQGPSDPAPSTALFARLPSDPTFSCHRRVEPGSAPAVPPRPIDRTVRAAQPTRVLRRARPPAPAPAPRPVPHATPIDPRAILERALELAERGLLERALETAATLLADPRSPEAAMAQGKILLAARQVEQAVEHLRRAVYLGGDARPMARYWYASALHLARNDRGAAKQLRELDRHLRALPAESLLEDGETRAAQLLDSVQLMLEGYE